MAIKSVSSRQKLILASGSKARRHLLTQAGITFSIQPATIDETRIVQELQGKLPAEDIAAELAQRKALTVAAENPDALVIGADQVLTCGGKLYQKAETPDEAREHIHALQGRTHQLLSAVCVVKEGNVIWSHVATAQLAMKAMDDDFINHYLAAAGDAALQAVGCYELEGLGGWLFEKIEGDYFTILGLPLLPLLTFLQTEGFGP